MVTKALTPTSSSFVVELKRGAGQEIIVPTKWSKGIVVRKFHGSLADGHIGSEAAVDSADALMESQNNETVTDLGND